MTSNDVSEDSMRQLEPSTVPPGEAERSALEEFERRIKEAGEREARLENLQKVAGVR